MAIEGAIGRIPRGLIVFPPLFCGSYYVAYAMQTVEVARASKPSLQWVNGTWIAQKQRR